MKTKKIGRPAQFGRRGVAVGAALVIGLGLAVAGATPAAAVTPSGSAPGASVAGTAANGGAVIVVLKNQHSNLNLRTQARQRTAAAHTDQDPLVASIIAHGGTHITRLTAPNAVAATLPAAGVARLRTDPAVAQIVPDVNIRIMPASPASSPQPTPQIAKPVAPNAPATTCPFNPRPARPLQEGEANTDVHASTGNPNSPDMANSIATGAGVIVANEGANELAGNPNFTRPDGSHVVIDAPDYTADHGNDETYGDVSSIAAQGTVTYQYAKALPQSGMPAGCTFDIMGVAPGASVVDLSQVDTPILQESQVIADINRMVTTVHADVISESFGGSSLPTASRLLAMANEAAVQAGVTVVESAGDSGASGTMISAADDPAVIATGAVDNFRLVAMADGYPAYLSNNMAGLSSGGTAPTGKVVDLVGPGWYGSEVACAAGIGGCPPDYPTESMRGTSESAPLTAGAAADVIQAYRDTHRGASPTPVVVKDILTSTATDLDAAADQQGAGLLNIYQAVRAAQQMPGTTDAQGPGDAPSLVLSPSQLDITAPGGSTAYRPVQVYNASDVATTVRSSYRMLGAEKRIGKVVTERVGAPKPGTPIPPEGATAAKTIAFRVPGGLDQLDTKMIWPDPTNGNRLYFQLFNPQGALVQESYDDGVIARKGIPNIQYTAVQNPAPGRWTARILWGGVDQDLALPPITPGSYRGTMSFQVGGQQFATSRAAAPLLIPAHSNGTVPLEVTMPRRPGDHPESVQLTAGNGAAASLPIARRSLIPSRGGTFATLITSSVGRSVGQISTYQVDVPSRRKYLRVTFSTADASPNNAYTFYLVDPSGAVAATATSPTTNARGKAVGKAQLYTNNPVAGTWTIDVVLDLTVSGKEFVQTVRGGLTD